MEEAYSKKSQNGSIMERVVREEGMVIILGQDGNKLNSCY